MFLGTHYPRLDDKGRLTLPAKFRDELAAKLWDRALLTGFAELVRAAPGPVVEVGRWWSSPAATTRTSAMRSAP